ncbi:MAG: hypothetical protein ACRD3K_15435 [Edaphobacter sp.]
MDQQLRGAREYLRPFVFSAQLDILNLDILNLADVTERVRKNRGALRTIHAGERLERSRDPLPGALRL